MALVEAGAGAEGAEKSKWDHLVNVAKILGTGIGGVAGYKAGGFQGAATGANLGSGIASMLGGAVHPDRNRSDVLLAAGLKQATQGAIATPMAIRLHEKQQEEERIKKLQEAFKALGVSAAGGHKGQLLAQAAQKWKAAGGNPRGFEASTGAATWYGLEPGSSAPTFVKPHVPPPQQSKQPFHMGATK